MAVSPSVRSPELCRVLNYLASRPDRFARAVRAAEYALSTQLHPLRWHRPTAPAELTAQAAEAASLALSDGSSIVRAGAPLGLDELRAAIAEYEMRACAAHRAKLVVASATGRKPKPDGAVTWPAGEPCVGRVENDTTPRSTAQVVVLAERAGRRLALLCSTVRDRDGLSRPSVRVAFQEHREFMGWTSKRGRELFLPWDSLATVRAAFEVTQEQADAENAERWARSTQENDQ